MANENRPHRRGKNSQSNRDTERLESKRPKCTECEENYDPSEKRTHEPGLCAQCEWDLGHV